MKIYSLLFTFDHKKSKNEWHPSLNPARMQVLMLKVGFVWRAFRQNSGKLEKAEILEMTVQYLRALHSADFPRGREKG